MRLLRRADNCFLDGCFLLMVILLTLGNSKLVVILITLDKSKIDLTTKLSQQRLDAWATFWATYPLYRHVTMASQTCKGLHQLWALPKLLLVAYFSWLLRLNFDLLFQHSELGYLWLPTPHWAAPVLLTGHHTMPAVTRCFPPNPYLGKQRISLGVASILSMFLCSYT